MLEAEWGSSAPIGMLKTAMRDSEGNEIPIPSCKTCGCGMSPMFGRHAFQWICLGCHCIMPVNEVMTKSFLKNLLS